MKFSAQLAGSPHQEAARKTGVFEWHPGDCACRKCRRARAARMRRAKPRYGQRAQ